jgi:hypothetical protein
MTKIRSLVSILFISLLFWGACKKNDVNHQFEINDLVNLNIIQRYLNKYPSLKGTHKYQKTGVAVIVYKCTINDTTRLIVNQTCTIKELLTFGYLYAYLVDGAYVFSNFELFYKRKKIDFDSAAARGTSDYYLFMMEEYPMSYSIDCYPYKPLRIIKFKDRILLYEFSYGFLPRQFIKAIMMKKVTKDRYAWYKKRAQNFNYHQ